MLEVQRSYGVSCFKISFYVRSFERRLNYREEKVIISLLSKGFSSVKCNLAFYEVRKTRQIETLVLAGG